MIIEIGRERLECFLRGRRRDAQLHRMLDQLREGDVVVVWKLDRLSRSLKDLLLILDKIEKAGAGFRSLTEHVDTTGLAGRMLMQLLGAFAEFERAMIRERVMAGLARARADGTKLGRQRLEESDAEKAAEVRAALASKQGIRRIARDLGVGVGTVLRIRDAPAP